MFVYNVPQSLLLPVVFFFFTAALYIWWIIVALYIMSSVTVERSVGRDGPECELSCTVRTCMHACMIMIMIFVFVVIMMMMMMVASRC